MATINLPYFSSGNLELNEAFRIALSDIIGNIQPFCDGLLEKEKSVILAGLGYDTPWTRDTSINIWNAFGLLSPEISKNTLLSVLKKEDGVIRPGGEYWDSIIWAIGSWFQYLFTGDKDFLAFSKTAVENALAYFEETEFDEARNLFRGQACYGDGIASYPAVYSYGESHVYDFPKEYPEKAAPKGVGIPMHCLSTNCLYYAAYRLVNKMAEELGQSTNESYAIKADALKAAIHKHFWMEDKGYFRYLVDDFGNCDHQEGMGNSFVLLFGIATEEQAKRLIENQNITPQGIACVWPGFPRYNTPDGEHYGRHSGTVWPHIQAFWGDAALRNGRTDLFCHELFSLANRAARDGHFAEIYHPVSGVIYGGLQERDKKGIDLWKSQPKQTWSATGYLRLLFMGLFGMEFSPEGILFHPYLPDGIGPISISDLNYRNMKLNIQVEGAGSNIDSFTIQGVPSKDYFLSAKQTGDIAIKIVLK